MNKITLLVALVVTSTFSCLNAQTTSPAPYCVAAFDDVPFSVPDAIKSVTFGSLINSSTTQYAFPHYVFYNNLAIPNFIKGSTANNLSVTFNVNGGCGYGVWIDYNSNNIFEANEKISGTPAGTILNISSSTTITQSVTIPATATIGNTRMRVRIVEDDNYTMGTNGYSIMPCNASASPTDVMDWGETEDYVINITSGLGLNEINENADLIVYPNPVTTTLNLKQDLSSNISFIIFSIAGQEMQTGTINNAQKQINVSSLSEGIYFLHLFENNKSLGQQKFVKSAN